MLRDPYLAGVERFEVPFGAQNGRMDMAQRSRQTALFCALAWKAFAQDLRSMRYSISYDNRPDITREFTQVPCYEELNEHDLWQASQIDIEFISIQSAPSTRAPHLRLHQSEPEHFPAFLEMFVPLDHNASQQNQGSLPQQLSEKLVIWCRPALLSQVLALWEQTSRLV